MNILIEVALPAEKYVYENIIDAKNKFLEDELIGAIIINAADYTPVSFFTWMDEVMPIFEPRKPKIVVYYDESQKDKIEPKMADFKLCYFFKHPLKKLDFNHVFNPIQTEKAKGKRSQQNEFNKNFVEASLHVKTTIELLNTITKNRHDLDAIRETGQRFNGLFGTFAFAKDISGYKELHKLSEIIDDLCRHYSVESQLEEISLPHFELLVSAAKCTYYMLKELRENRPLTESHLNVYAKVVDTFEKFPEIKRRASKTQDEVDDILKQFGA